MKFRIAIVVVVVGFAAWAGWTQWGPRRAPTGQAPMAVLNPAALPGFEAQFNAQPQDARVLLLLSPT